MPENKQILITEDEKPLRIALIDRFNRDGFKTLEAQNGQVALDLALKEHPDVILLDIMMPIMDGLKMIEELRKDDWGKNAKVILLTNLSDSEKVATAVENYTFDYLVKSNTKIEDVVKKVKSMIDA